MPEVVGIEPHGVAVGVESHAWAARVAEYMQREATFAVLEFKDMVLHRFGRREAHPDVARLANAVNTVDRLGVRNVTRLWRRQLQQAVETGSAQHESAVVEWNEASRVRRVAFQD